MRQAIKCLLFLAFFWSNTAASALSLPPSIKLAPQSLITKIAVLGKDERTRLPERYVDLAAGIGILGQHGRVGWSCTAFCVAPNVIATNAHCVVKNPTVGRRLDLSRTLFVLPKFKRSSTGSKFKSRISYPEFVDPRRPALSIYYGNFNNIRSVNAQGQDWAFVKLIHSVCRGRTLKFSQRPMSEIRKAAKKKQVFMIGFHGDKKMEERLFSKDCAIRSPSDRKYFLNAQRRRMLRQAVLLPHTCDAFKGSSGSPIFLETKDGPKVIGINLGSLRYERYQIKKNRYTGKIISRKKLKNGRETNMAVQPRAFMDGLDRFKNEQLLNSIHDLRRLQSNLKKLGFYRGRIDGLFGKGTRRAVITFERKQNLIALGLPTRQLLERLDNQITQQDEARNQVLRDENAAHQPASEL
ncbi:MAG: hypothetical protein DHS20C08_19710 [Rhodomicrobium sp.]|nr:MAG: hypothetical protein DHS20C08_19710 [Rhodomicrobium sp.]